METKNKKTYSYLAEDIAKGTKKCAKKENLNLKIINIVYKQLKLKIKYPK